METVVLEPGSRATVEITVPASPPGTIVGVGGWVYVDGVVEVEFNAPSPKTTLRLFAAPDWGKFGSQWFSTEANATTATLLIAAVERAEIAFFDVAGGIVEHSYLAGARPELMTNMHDYAPEANFIDAPSRVVVRVEGPSTTGAGAVLTRKSCNRCGRFLPINVGNERNHLSFTNHCVAASRRPCSHSSFGRIRAADGSANLVLEYGYQLECRFCKKFEVNSAHNPQRSAAQMKEDAARRRGFELLLSELLGGSASLLYRRATGGHELADDVYSRFDGRCFKCGIQLTPKEMHLDHTRPLALLWPLDGTATALCSTHNGQKRDRPPAAYYGVAEIRALAGITGLQVAELLDPAPNMVAIELLLSRLDWFMDEFLQRPEMQEVHEGKLAADLVLKALNKVLGNAGVDIDLVALYRRRVGHTK